MFLEKVKGIFNTISIMELLLSIIYFVMGIILFALSTVSVKALAIIIGIILICNGFVNIFSYIKRDNVTLFNYNLIYAVIMIAIGILTFTISDSLIILLGLFLILIGVQKIHYSMVLNKVGEPSWLFTLGVGILLIIIAIVSFFTDSYLLMNVCGILLIGYGVMNFVNYLLLRLRAKDFIE